MDMFDSSRNFIDYKKAYIYNIYAFSYIKVKNTYK